MDEDKLHYIRESRLNELEAKEKEHKKLRESLIYVKNCIIRLSTKSMDISNQDKILSEINRVLDKTV